MRDIFVKLFDALWLLHTVTKKLLHKPLDLLCKYSGRDSYFWSKAMFWVSVALCFASIGSMLFLIVTYIFLPFLFIGKKFFLPAVANSLRNSDGESLPYELVVVPILIFSHLWNICFSLFMMPISDTNIYDLLCLIGYGFGYVSICFLIDYHPGGKSLLKRVSGKLKKLSGKAKEKISGDGAMPQPV